MKKKKLKVGQKIWVQKLRGDYKNEPPFLAKVSKVGRKYFEVDKCFRSKFEIETGKEVSDFLSHLKIWFKIEDWNIYIQEYKVKTFVDDYFRYKPAELTADQYKRISDIICDRSKYNSSTGVKKDGTGS